MIVHLVSPDVRASGGTFLKMKGTVLDKIRADYNTEKRDRFVFPQLTHNREPKMAFVDVYNFRGPRKRQPNYLG
jgi:hypothetical protein